MSCQDYVQIKYSWLTSNTDSEDYHLKTKVCVPDCPEHGPEFNPLNLWSEEKTRSQEL